MPKHPNMGIAEAQIPDLSPQLSRQT